MDVTAGILFQNNTSFITVKDMVWRMKLYPLLSSSIHQDSLLQQHDLLMLIDFLRFMNDPLFASKLLWW
jgi:hypothetical protein